MYGLSVIFVLGIYIFLAATCVFFVKKRPYRIIVLLVFIAIPVGDIIPKRILFELKCNRNEIIINSFAEDAGLYEKNPYGFNEFVFPFEDNRSEDKKKASLDRLVRTFLMHPLRGYLIKNGLFLEIEWYNYDYKMQRKGRFWVEESGNHHCLKDITADDLRNIHNKDYPSQTTGKCVAGYPIEKIAAKYILDEFVPRDTGLWGVDEESAVIYNRETNEELASASIIYLRNNWVLGILEPRGVVDSCGPWRACASKKIAKLFFENAEGTQKPFQFTPQEESRFCSEVLDLLFWE